MLDCRIIIDKRLTATERESDGEVERILKEIEGSLSISTPAQP